MKIRNFVTATFAAIYGNDAEEAMYPKCREDADGSWTAPNMEMV